LVQEPPPSLPLVADSQHADFDVAPVPDVVLPDGQAVHAPVPDVDLYVPWAQAKQLPADR